MDNTANMLMPLVAAFAIEPQVRLSSFKGYIAGLAGTSLYYALYKRMMNSIGNRVPWGKYFLDKRDAIRQRVLGISEYSSSIVLCNMVWLLMTLCRHTVVLLPFCLSLIRVINDSDDLNDWSLVLGTTCIWLVYPLLILVLARYEVCSSCKMSIKRSVLLLFLAIPFVLARVVLCFSLGDDDDGGDDETLKWTTVDWVTTSISAVDMLVTVCWWYPIACN